MMEANFKGGTALLTKTRFGLSGNQLKLIALATMTLDHVGAYLLPQVLFLRILGRLSLPIYAYMIAEGCRHTRSRWRYFLRLLGLGVCCQLVNYLVTGSLYQGILITFSLSVLLIFLLEHDRTAPSFPAALLLGGTFFAAGFLCEILPKLLPQTDFGIDYGFAGVMLPILIYLGQTRSQRLLLLSIGLVLLSWNLGGVQWFCLAAIPVLALYTGEKGQHAIGRMFYLYYPAHLVVIYGIGAILQI